jgi:hypothetical protein
VTLRRAPPVRSGIGAIDERALRLLADGRNCHDRGRPRHPRAVTRNEAGAIPEERVRSVGVTCAMVTSMLRVAGRAIVLTVSLFRTWAWFGPVGGFHT